MPGAADPMVSTDHAGGCEQGLRAYWIGPDAPVATRTRARASGRSDRLIHIRVHTLVHRRVRKPGLSQGGPRPLKYTKPCLVSMNTPRLGASVHAFGHGCTAYVGSVCNLWYLGCAAGGLGRAERGTDRFWGWSWARQRSQGGTGSRSRRRAHQLTRPSALADGPALGWCPRAVFGKKYSV